jgi:transposase
MRAVSERPTITSPFSPDLAEVRAWIEKAIASMKLVELVVAVMALLTRMRDINTELTKQVAHLRRRRPRSETLGRVERQLAFAFAGTVLVATDPAAAASERKVPRSRRGRHPGRAALPASLERVVVENRVPAEMRICPDCGSEMPTVGHSVCEILDVVPARVFVRQRKDETVACRYDDTIVSAPTPPELVERGKLGLTLIVEALADKYLEHLPIERQCLRYARAGVDIAPQTLGRSVAAAVDLIAALAKVIETETRAPGLLGTDATTIPVLDRDAPQGIRLGTMWCWTRARWVTFFYSPAGDSDSVRRFLGNDLRRAVQCDGTSVTTFLERAGGTRPGCWSHGRRRLVECARGGDALALEGLRLIQPLFEIERAASLVGDTVEERCARRIEHSVPVLATLRAWIDEHRGRIPPKTPLGQALGYLHRQWNRLTLFLTDGNIELTNNRRERELRKLVLGRRNWLFTWEDLGGERTASILSVVASCVAHDVNPRAYLHMVTKLLVEGWPQAKIRDLLPDRMLTANPDLYIGERPALPVPVRAPPSLSAPAG